jgi:hypothetical protein
VTKTQQNKEPGGGRIRPSTAHWCTLSAALDELGWPWLRLRGELVARRLSYRTYPPGHEIDWGDSTLHVDHTESTVTIARAQEVVKGEGRIAFIWPGTERLTVAVEALLPVGQRPEAAVIKASWRDRVPEADLESAMKDIAQSYDGKPPPSENDVWLELKARFGPDLPRDAARDGLAIYAPRLKRARGQTKKIKSRS